MFSAAIFCFLFVSVSCFQNIGTQGTNQAAPRVTHAEALRRHHQAVSSHNTDNPYWAVVDVQPKYTGPMAGGDLFWANPAARAWFPQEPAAAPVQPKPQPAAYQPQPQMYAEPAPQPTITTAPVVDRATALKRHGEALMRHNVNNIFWAVPTNPQPAAQTIAKPTPGKWNGPMAGGDLFWANPSARPAAGRFF